MRFVNVNPRMRDPGYILDKLRWMRDEHIWPNGPRYLWTDAFGVILMCSLYRSLGEEQFLIEAKQLVSDVERVLGRPAGLRIGEAPDRDGQYFHYLAMWIHALATLGTVEPEYHDGAVQLVRQIHSRFVVPRIGVVWKMREDLSGPYPGFGFGALDPFHGYVVYRLTDEVALRGEIEQMRELVESSYAALVITQDLGLGMMLWLSSFFPDEPWAVVQRARSLDALDRMWIESQGYFCREPTMRDVKFAFTNYGVSLGLQAVGAHPDRVLRLERFFDRYRSGDEYDNSAITHVMACSSRLPGLLLPARVDTAADSRV